MFWKPVHCWKYLEVNSFWSGSVLLTPSKGGMIGIVGLGVSIERGGRDEGLVGRK